MNAERRLRPMDPSVSPRFGDVATLLRAPRVPLGPDIDIALVGVPFDLGTNYRTGARGGPAAGGGGKGTKTPGDPPPQKGAGDKVGCTPAA